MRNLSRTTRTNGEKLLFHVINRKKIQESCEFSKQRHVFKVEKKYLIVAFTENFVHYGTAPVDPRRPQNRWSNDYLRAHKGSRRMSRPLIQDSSVSVLFPRYKGNLT